MSKESKLMSRGRGSANLTNKCVLKQDLSLIGFAGAWAFEFQEKRESWRNGDWNVSASWVVASWQERRTNDEQQWKAAAEETKKIEDGRWIWVSSTAAGIETEPGEEGGGDGRVEEM
jgi:hypothetical protein